MTDTVGGSLGDSSLLLSKTQSSFDVQKESDVISLLKLIHQSALDPDIKNHLRDLIFTYRQIQTQSGLQGIHDAFEKLGIEIPVARESGSASADPSTKVGPRPVAKAVSRLGIRRPQPQFIHTAASASVTETVAPIARPSSWSHATQTASAGEIAPSQEQTKTEKEEPVKVESQRETSSETQPAKEVVPAPQPIIAPNTATYTDASSRIKEIKRIVNEKIGNPINLIDANNEIGRSYMNALLDAMKKSNGGSPEELSQAMEHLEKAFAEVQTVIFNGVSTHPAAEAKTAVKHEPVATPTPLPKTDVTRPAADQTPVGNSSAGSETPVRDIPTFPPQNDTITKWGEVRVHKEPIGGTTSVEQTDKTDAVPLNATAKIPSVMDALRSPQTPKEAAPQKMVDTGDVHSVAKEKQLQDLMRANQLKQAQLANEKEEARIATLDPLLTPQVDSGLAQLLTEWSLFKSSGIFGTGPSGKEHVLFKQLAPLPMAAIVAGRFEGATPKIKQSITDYMNGWRYEDGIIHEPAETFEHYLRKVVRHILDKQGRK